jgi:hypothetical protein
VGIFGAILSGVCLVYLFFFGEMPYRVDQIKIVAGRVADAQIVHHSDSADSLNLWLESQPVPYRWNVRMPQSRVDSPVSYLSGASAEIGVRESEMASPRRDYARHEDFLPIYSLTVAGRVFFSLDDYNVWTSHNQNVGKLVCSSVFLCSIALFLYARRHLASASDHVMPRTAR